VTHGLVFSNLVIISGYSIILCKEELCVEVICKTIKPIQVTHIILLPLFQIVGHFGESTFIAFAMHLNKHYV